MNMIIVYLSDTLKEFIVFIYLDNNAVSLHIPVNSTDLSTTLLSSNPIFKLDL